MAAAVVSRQKKRWRLFSLAVGDARDAQRVRDDRGIFGFAPRLETVAATLSQGEKKLLDVASAFALDPAVILLDEPTSGVSTADKHGIMKSLIAAAKAPACKASSWSSTIWTWWQPTRIASSRLPEGRVLADLPPDRFFADPA